MTRPPLQGLLPYSDESDKEYSRHSAFTKQDAGERVHKKDRTIKERPTPPPPPPSVRCRQASQATFDRSKVAFTQSVDIKLGLTLYSTGKVNSPPFLLNSYSGALGVI